MQAHRVSESAVIAVQTPPGTKTHRPLPHYELIAHLAEATEKAGLAVANKQYSLSGDGNRLFGVWSLINGHEADMRGAIGLRNAHDKSMAVGLCAGTEVMVCSNMAFNGEWVEFRKHTGGFTLSRLRSMLDSAIRQIMDRIADFKVWHRGLHEYGLDPIEQRLLTFQAAETGIIPFSDCPKMVDLVINPETRIYEPTLYGWHGGVTQIMRDKSLTGISRTHGKLTRFVNGFVKS